MSARRHAPASHEEERWNSTKADRQQWLVYCVFVGATWVHINIFKCSNGQILTNDMVCLTQVPCPARLHSSLVFCCVGLTPQDIVHAMWFDVPEKHVCPLWGIVCPLQVNCLHFDWNDPNPCQFLVLHEFSSAVLDHLFCSIVEPQLFLRQAILSCVAWLGPVLSSMGFIVNQFSSSFSFFFPASRQTR